MPEEYAAWEALSLFWHPAVTVYSINPEARASARHLCDLTEHIAEYHLAGHWLQQLFRVLDDEPIVVIEPTTKLGVLGRISGVVDNFQLNVLLRDCFPKSGFSPRDVRLERLPR